MPHSLLRNNLSLCAITLLSMLVAACSPGTRIAKNQPINRSAPIGSHGFPPSVTAAADSPWIEGNDITTLVNGQAFFPAMLDSIRAAQKSITFETYAYINGTMAFIFSKAFCERARNGVKVHLLLDSMGSTDIGEKNVQRMRDAGVEVTFYHPYAPLNPLRSNTRDHRKLMVVDGNIGFMGGCGVADAWSGNAHTPKHWRENHYQITGPVVTEIQKAFTKNWLYAEGTALTGPTYFPKLAQTGKIKAQACISSPKDKHFTIPHVYRQVIASARKSIIIENSYFIPDHSLMKEIIAARNRGVHIEIIIPGKQTDSWPTLTLARGYYKKLLHAGVEIYEYQGTMMHCKVLVIDDVFSSIGSANFDPRSLYINDESNLNVLDAGFAKEQRSIIENDKKHSLRITKAPSPWNPLTLPKRIAAKIMETQL